MSPALLLVLAGVLWILGVFFRAVVADELKAFFQRRAERRLERAIDALPDDVRQGWAAGWREQFAAIAALPLSAARYEIAVRGLPGSIRDAESSLERTLDALPAELREEWEEEWRGELLSLGQDPMTAGRWAKGIRRSARELTNPQLAVLTPNLPIRPPRWSRRSPSRRSQQKQRSARAASNLVEWNILVSATLCLLAFGAIMVFSATSRQTSGQDFGSEFLVRYLFYGVIGLATMRVIARRPLQRVLDLTGPLLGVCVLLLILVQVPGVGVEVAGARRWLGAGPLHFQPAELTKLALVLYAVKFLALKPDSVSRPRLLAPLLGVVLAACVLITSQPDLGAALVIAFTSLAVLLAAGLPLRHLAVGAAGCSATLVLLLLAEHAVSGCSPCSWTRGRTLAAPGSRPSRDRSRWDPADCSDVASASRCRRSSICPRPTATSSWPSSAKSSASWAWRRSCSCSAC